jgi:hypothetical protein
MSTSFMHERSVEESTGGSSCAADKTRWMPTATPSIQATWPRNSTWRSTSAPLLVLLEATAG